MVQIFKCKQCQLFNQSKTRQTKGQSHKKNNKAGKFPKREGVPRDPQMGNYFFLAKKIK